MATVNIKEILGSDSIIGSRLTINSNFLVLKNWINGYSNTFNIDYVNGKLDLSNASTGEIAAKKASFDYLSLPSAGATAKAFINSLGEGNFQSIQANIITASNSTLNGNTSLSAITVGATATFNGATNINNTLMLGASGTIASTNNKYKAGYAPGTQFPTNILGGGGIETTVNAPYIVTGKEDVIYANCAAGFYLKVVDGTGATASNIPQGTRITIVNTSGSTGNIITGVTGASPYYTGFNTNSTYGGFNSAGLRVTAGKSYRSSITLQWESRIAYSQSAQKGSWIVLASNNILV